MNSVDWLLIGGFVVFALVGWRQGFVAGALSFLGFLGGGLLAVLWLPDVVERFVDSSWWQIVVVAVGVLVSAILGQALLSILGRRLRSSMTWRPVRFVDNVGGAALNVMALVLVAWVVASVVAFLPRTDVTRQVNESLVLTTTDRMLPEAALSAFDGLRDIVGETAVPRVFAGVAPVPGPDVDAPVAVVPQGSRRRPPFHAPARCRTAMRASYWAQPALLSRGALTRAAAAFRAGGTQSECRLFDVSHEGGLGVLLWSLGVESLGLPEPDAYLRDSRYLRGLPGAREFRRMRLQRPKHKPVAVHRVARGNDYPTAHAVRAALASPEYTRIPATATVLRGAIPPRDVPPGAPFAPFRPEDCAPPSPLS